MDYNGTLKKVLYFAIIISLIGFLLLIILIYGMCNNYNMVTDDDSGTKVRQYEDCEEDGVLWTSIGLLSLAGFIALCIVITGLKTEPSFIDLDKEIEKTLKEYLEFENSKNHKL